jgi:hypothetical protein
MPVDPRRRNAQGHVRRARPAQVDPAEIGERKPADLREKAARTLELLNASKRPVILPATESASLTLKGIF